MSIIDTLDRSRLPQHVAIIMDGNGRWAKERGLERFQGHIEGVESVRAITEAATELGIKYLTLYTFSTENWNRPKEEVEALMSLLVAQIEKETTTFIKNNIRFQIIGDYNRMPESVRPRLDKCIAETAHHTGLTLVLALSYSSRWEITSAAQSIAAAVQAGNLAVDAIDEKVFAKHLATASMPDPDLLIRTGKEYRISNYLLWQISYAELAFPEMFWPDFRKEEFYAVLKEYQQRERRFGKTSEQIAQ